MVLIVNKTTGRIINDYLLKDGDLKSEQLFETWRRADGVVVYPNDCCLVVKWEGEYDFNTDEALLGYTNTYYYIDGEIVLKRVIEPEYVQQQIGWLKDDLRTTDYKVIKAYEAQLIGLSVPYDFSLVHVERQTIREKINRLEQLKT